MDWIGSILCIIGILLNSKKLIWCWPVWTASTIFWVIFAVQNQQWAILMMEVVFFVANLYGWQQWRLDEQATLITEIEKRQRGKS